MFPTDSMKRCVGPAVVITPNHMPADPPINKVSL